MSEPWAEAVRIGLESQPVDLEGAVREELGNLWFDLDEAISRALNGHWSMGCNWFTERIVTLSRLAGVTPWDQVPLTLLASGTYQGILTTAGFSYPEPDMTMVQEMLAEVRGAKL